MSKPVRRRAVRLALIGLGPVWEQRYRPALARLMQRSGTRLQIAAVYDPVFSRAEMVAQEFSASSMTGLTCLASRNDIDGCLLLDHGWIGPSLAEYVASLGKPLFLARPFPADTAWISRLASQAAPKNTTVVIEQLRRFEPSTARLRELVAVHLGEIRGIDWHVSENFFACSNAGEQPSTGLAPQAERLLMLAELVDWANYLLGKSPSWRDRNDSDDPRQLMRLAYESSREGIRIQPIDMRILASNQELSDCPASFCTVSCERGEVRISGPRQLSWTTEIGSHSEELLDEREPLDLLLDLFCRRLAGGLLPIPELRDFTESWRLVTANIRLN